MPVAHGAGVGTTGAKNVGFMGKWTQSQRDESIEYKELFAVLAACATWGSDWISKHICLHCDNTAVVACITSRTSRAPQLMPLLRSLAMVCAQLYFVFFVQLVPGHFNATGDSPSHNNLQAFHRLAPSAQDTPDVVPQLPLDL